MDILDFAVYVAPPYVVAAFAFGATYRLLKYIFLWKRGPGPEPRKRGAGSLVKGLIMTFLNPIIESIRRKPHDFITGLVMLHILGVIPLIFLLDQHIAAFAYWFPPYALLAPLAIPLSFTTSALTVAAPFKPVSEMQWGFVNTIWGPLTVFLNGDVLAVLAMLGVAYKIGDKIVRRAHGLTHVRIGDFFDLGLLFTILLFGFMAAHHLPSGDIVTYRTVLGIHIVLAELLVALLPFTKFWHFVFGFWYGKLHEWYDLKYKRGVAE